MAVANLTTNDFQKVVLDKKGVVFIDFYADWCGPCKVTSPIIEELSNQFTEVTFVKVNVDENPDLASQYSVFSIPSFFIFRGGKVVSQFVGAMGKEGFVKEINTILHTS